MTTKKTIVHKNTERCRLTNKTINTRKDKYAILLECKGDDIFHVSFWIHSNMNSLITGNIKKIQEEIAKIQGQAVKSIVGGDPRVDKIVKNLVQAR